MRAVAIREPYASLVAIGRKSIECRTWRTSWRGQIVIAASSTIDRDACRRFPRVRVRPSTIAALATLVDVRPFRASDARKACMRPVDEWHLDDYFAWILSDVQSLRRVPFTRSRLGVFRIDARLVRVAAR